MDRKEAKNIEAGIGEVLALLPTDRDIVIAVRYAGGPDSLIKSITEARQRLENLRSKLQEQTKS